MRYSLLLLSLAACAPPPGDDDANAPAPSDNRAPGAPEVSISPTLPTSDEPLVLNFVLEADDPDGDELTYEIRWTRDGVPVSDVDNEERVPPRLTARGEVWRVAVRGFDGWETGPAATDEVVIGDAPPKLAGTWRNTFPLPDRPIAYDVEVTDSDGDEHVLTWNWTLNGKSLDPTDSPESPIISGRDGDVVEVDVEVVGFSTHHAEMVVVDRAPTLSWAAVVPVPAFDGQAVGVEHDGEDPDGESIGTSYEWWVDSVFQGSTGIPLLILDAEGQSVVCRVSVWDPNDKPGTKVQFTTPAYIHR